METVASLFGILNVNKPPGCTSRDAVDRVERLTRPAKCGHAGTLDPLATGVLVVCVGPATRLIQYVQQLRKEYRATFLLGRRSFTDDTEGDVELLENAPQPTRAEIEAALPHFMGDIQQRPPAFSAVKIEGRRAYDLARRGETFELAPRTITVHRLEVMGYEYPELQLAIECGSGTYVRSLGRDLAVALGTAAVMSALTRIAIGHFRLEDAASLDTLTPQTLPQYLQPALNGVAHLSRMTLSDSQLAEIRHGRPIPRLKRPEEESTAGEIMGVNAAGELVSILTEKQQGQLWPVRNFEV